MCPVGNDVHEATTAAFYPRAPDIACSPPPVQGGIEGGRLRVAASNGN